jgi:ribosomal protein S18 acetylase RimI-like enzyme
VSDYEFPQAPEIEAAYRTTHRALLDIVPPERTWGDSEDNVQIGDLISHVRHLLGEAEMCVAAQLGPRISWYAPATDGDWDLVLTGIDLDEYAEEFGDVEFEESAFEGPYGKWHGSPLERAAYAYKREARWDFAPGHAGIWMLMLAPTSAGGGDTWIYGGHLVGFVVLHDRDKDGVYESVAHIWTASAWRRRGIARRLLTEAKNRFGITIVEGPYTKDGGALLRAVGELETEDEA